MRGQTPRKSRKGSTLTAIDDIDREIIADREAGIDPTHTAARLGLDTSEVYRRMVTPQFRVARLESTRKTYDSIHSIVREAAFKAAKRLLQQDDIPRAAAFVQADIAIIRQSIELMKETELVPRVAEMTAVLGEDGVA